MLIRELPTVSVTKDGWDRAYVVFNGILIVVGTIGVVAAIKTLRTIKRQADLMDRQTGILEKSVAAAEKGAHAAEKSISVVIEKERARLFIEVDNLQLPQLQPEFWLLDITYKLFIYGSTLAFVEDSNATVFVSQSENPPTKNGYQRVVTKPVITPTPDAISLNATSFGPSRGEKPILEQIWKRQQFIHFFGFISYRDLWGNPHRTTFRFRWDITDLRNFDGTLFALWHKVGPPEDNSET